ncbi:unnamed protein product [Angiostrongylus costaricensis]|uniref:ALOG domain-containing protein n=1 Tax=Angiostrongylus costaricensis TaxID=334426 RepID=A0A0R3PII9_ANGCS|nr:unnamed protein product [Angiostrongylus costaricensis]
MITAHFGCPAFDLVRVMCACLSGKDRQEQWEELLDEFYGYLKEECGNRDMPYTLKQVSWNIARMCNRSPTLFPLQAQISLPKRNHLKNFISRLKYALREIFLAQRIVSPIFPSWRFDDNAYDWASIRHNL